ncbi:YbaB/EbfC family nucleoid-associated protein [Cytophagaceae bacterium ABcell3]|nr:YbaB/EbfC family nucleoid-associated protein [Cytophagaceae bacterium ABcell3]
MFDMMNMLGKVKEVQAKLNEAKQNLGKIEITSESGGGMVKATVNGHRQLIKLEVDNDLVKPEDKDMLQDLIVAATNKALADIEEKIREEMKKSTQGVLPDIPGFDFGNLV